jgi:predicted Fe-S protein YdhL (DUF1289 family)
MTAAQVASPCSNVCRINRRSRWCEGCWRTADEIMAWPTASDAQRRDILAALPARRAAGHGGNRGQRPQ